MIRKLILPPAYIERIKKYETALKKEEFHESAHAKSDYWLDHSAKVHIQFLSDGVGLSGVSGFYIPPEAGSFQYRLRDWVQARYKKIVLFCDRLLRLSAPHGLNSSVTYTMAYDFVFGGHSAMDHDENPYCFDWRRVTPVLERPRFWGYVKAGYPAQPDSIG